jgi:hypothetical protein
VRSLVRIIPYSIIKQNNPLKKAIITGITGQDGANLAEFLLNKGYEVQTEKRYLFIFLNHFTMI